MQPITSNHNGITTDQQGLGLLKYHAA